MVHPQELAPSLHLIGFKKVSAWNSRTLDKARDIAEASQGSLVQVALFKTTNGDLYHANKLKQPKPGKKLLSKAVMLHEQEANNIGEAELKRDALKLQKLKPTILKLRPPDLSLQLQVSIEEHPSLLAYLTAACGSSRGLGNRVPVCRAS